MRRIITILIATVLFLSCASTTDQNTLIDETKATPGDQPQELVVGFIYQINNDTATKRTIPTPDRKGLPTLKPELKAKRVIIDGLSGDNNYNNSASFMLTSVNNKLYMLQKGYSNEKNDIYLANIIEIGNNRVKKVVKNIPDDSALYGSQGLLYYSSDYEDGMIYTYDPKNKTKQLLMSDARLLKATANELFLMKESENSIIMSSGKSKTAFLISCFDITYITEGYIYIISKSDDKTDNDILLRINLITKKVETVLDITELAWFCEIGSFDCIDFIVHNDCIAFSFSLDNFAFDYDYDEEDDDYDYDSGEAVIIVLDTASKQITILETPYTHDGLCFFNAFQDNIYINGEAALYKYNLVTSQYDILVFFDYYYDPQLLMISVFDDKWVYISGYNPSSGKNILFRIGQDGKDLTQISLK